ncbi:hypothetical protein [Fibrobacter sp. UWH4]|uniref:hypothetical protein n=1 Tax=Fibrobacter sp. UWH4 TaxID=1896210 RepID=UPI000922A980|nr:hypothetical protein [Fibrobacter sp. UWH4]SHL80450.1 hypothetical protein SAMN05720762_11511 [Fibrobacter sp. UWH4]
MVVGLKSSIINLFYVRTPLQIEACHNFWQPLVKKIYACNTDGFFPDKDGVYAAFIRLKKARPNVGFEISYKQESWGYRECDKTQAICISKSFVGRGSISLIVNCEAEFLSIHFQHTDIEAFNVSLRRSQCDLGATLDNLANFIEKFPIYCEQSSRIIIEIEKEQKLEKIARDTIRATISHIMESSKYSWNLTKDENTFSLEVSINDEYTVEMDFDTQNYLERIPALQGILKQTENFLKEIPFPITIRLQEKT